MARPTATPPAAGLQRRTRALLPPALLGAAEDEPDPVVPRSRRDWLVDTACFLLALGIGTLGFVGSYDDGPRGDWVAWVDLLGGLALCGGLWVRRRFPVALVLASLPLSCFSTMAGGAGAVALFSLAVHRDTRVVAPLVALQVPTTFVYAALRPEADMDYGWLVAFVLFALGLVVAWGTAIRSRRELLRSLTDRAARAEGEQQLRVAQARDHERARIAREMHDVLAHRISLVSLHAGALEFRPDAPPEEVARAAAVIRSSAHEALEDLREVIGVLRDGDSTAEGESAAAPSSEVRPQPSIGDLPALLRESRAAGMRIDDRLEAADDRLPGAVGRTAYRVVQEGLTNARKHAWGTVVHVRSSGAPGTGLTVEVLTPKAVGGSNRDPGIPGAGTGIVGLQERAALAGGRLEATPTPDGGFLLRAWLPWAAT